VQDAETTNVHPGLQIQDHEQVTLRVVYLAVDNRRVTPLRASKGSTRRDRPTRQVVRRTTYEAVRGDRAQLTPICRLRRRRDGESPLNFQIFLQPAANRWKVGHTSAGRSGPSLGVKTIHAGCNARLSGSFSS
jgi:hypothetical protein